MEISTAFRGTTGIISVSGRFDAHHVNIVKEHIDDAIKKSPKIVVDLNEVSFMDSAALATLVQGMKHCRQAGGDLRVCNLKEPVRIIFELTRLDKAFALYNNMNEALASF